MRLGELLPLFVLMQLNEQTNQIIPQRSVDLSRRAALPEARASTKNTIRRNRTSAHFGRTNSPKQSQAGRRRRQQVVSRAWPERGVRDILDTDAHESRRKRRENNRSVSHTTQPSPQQNRQPATPQAPATKRSAVRSAFPAHNGRSPNNAGIVFPFNTKQRHFQSTRHGPGPDAPISQYQYHQSQTYVILQNAACACKRRLGRSQLCL